MRSVGPGFLPVASTQGPLRPGTRPSENAGSACQGWPVFEPPHQAGSPGWGCRAGGNGARGSPVATADDRPGSAPVEITYRVGVARTVRPRVMPGFLGVNGGQSGTPTIGRPNALADASQTRVGNGTYALPRREAPPPACDREQLRTSGAAMHPKEP